MKMKHSLIALAVAAASSAAVVTPAQAGDVTVYGIAQVELAAVSYQTEGTTCDTPDSDVGKAPNGCDGLDVVDNSMGRVGVKASEDLGNGMTGLAKFEFKADTADNNVNGASLTARESMVGLKAGWGQFEMGNLKSAYKYAGGVKYDAFVATTLQARGNGGMSGNALYTVNANVPSGQSYMGHNGFLANQLGYQYGSKAGFSLRLTYGAADGDGSYSANAMFKQDKWEAFVAAYGSGDQLDAGAGTSYDAVKAGGAFKFGAHKFMLQYEATTWKSGVAGAEDEKPSYIFAAWNMKMGKNMFVVNVGQYTADEKPEPTNKGDTLYYALGMYHNFSKTTSIFGGYRASDADNDQMSSVFSLGLKKKF